MVFSDVVSFVQIVFFLSVIHAQTVGVSELAVS